jgi:hypothetical protein
LAYATYQPSGPALKGNFHLDQPSYSCMHNPEM